MGRMRQMGRMKPKANLAVSDGASGWVVWDGWDGCDRCDAWWLGRDWIWRPGSLGRALAGAGVKAGAGHALAQAAFSQEILFESAELLVEQVVGLVNQADENVCHDVGGTGFDVGPI